MGDKLRSLKEVIEQYRSSIPIVEGGDYVRIEELEAWEKERARAEELEELVKILMAPRNQGNLAAASARFELSEFLQEKEEDVTGERDTSVSKSETKEE